MDPARPAGPDPADPFLGERGGDAVLETIEIATEGEDCDECVRKLRPMLKNIRGVQDVKVDLESERVILTLHAEVDCRRRAADCSPTTAIVWNSRRIPNTIHGKNCATRRIDFRHTAGCCCVRQ